MDAFLDFVKFFGFDTVVGSTDDQPNVPDPDISLYGSFVFDNDTVALFDDGTQIII